MRISSEKGIYYIPLGQYQSKKKTRLKKTSLYMFMHLYTLLSVKVFANNANYELDKSKWCIISFCMSSVLTGYRTPTTTRKNAFSVVTRKKEVKKSGHKIQASRPRSKQSKSKMMKKSLSMWMWIIIWTFRMERTLYAWWKCALALQRETLYRIIKKLCVGSGNNGKTQWKKKTSK